MADNNTALGLALLALGKPSGGSGYSISYSLTHCAASATNPTAILSKNIAELTFTSDSGYEILTTPTVSGASIRSYDSSTNKLLIENPTGNVTITVAASSQLDYLCFTAGEANSTVSMMQTGTPSTAKSLETSTDKTTWTPFTIGTTTITLANIGDKVYFRGNNSCISESSSIYANFVFSGLVAGSGNIMSLIDKTLESTTVPDYCFVKLFYSCTSLTSAPKLPATTLGIQCYGDMFYLCPSLANAPNLPATTLSNYCYQGMLRGCTSLTAPPALPATTLTTNCYAGLIRDCTSLTHVPALPATTLGNYSFTGFAWGCTSLIVSDTQTTDAQYAWRIPTSGTFTNSNNYYNVFNDCAGTRSSSSLYCYSGSSVTYYTQNEPVE